MFQSTHGQTAGWVQGCDQYAVELPMAHLLGDLAGDGDLAMQKATILWNSHAMKVGGVYREEKLQQTKESQSNSNEYKHHTLPTATARAHSRGNRSGGREASQGSVGERWGGW